MTIGSTAATWNVCSPGARPVYVIGEEHGVAGARSSEHWKVAVPCVEKNVNVAVVDELGSAGAVMISVSGSFTPPGRATVHSKTAGGSSRWRNLLLDCTSNVWSPSGTCVTVVGEVHGASSAPSNEHMYETPVWFDVQLNVALVLVVVVVPFVFAGTLAVIVVSAGPSTSHVKTTGVRSTFPAGSIARTSSVWWPASGVSSALLSGGEAHSLHSGSGAGSSAHSKLTPGSVLAKMKTDGRSTFVWAGGASEIAVS